MLLVCLGSVAASLAQPVGPPPPATASDAPPPPAVAGPEPAPAPAGSWFRRTLHRYFSNAEPEGSALGGQAVALADRYTRYGGRPIAVVIVQQVDRLRPEDATRSELMSSFARALHPYTSESVLRQYLRFHQGEPLDPLKLADSERLLRSIEYVADVRLHVVPLTGDENEVAVIVEVRDRLPVGAHLDIRAVDRYEAGLFHSNIAGQNLRLAVDLFYRSGVTPEAGWGTQLRKRNFGGTFIDGELGYEDSWRVFERRVTLARDEVHPDIRWVGGGSWRFRQSRDPARPPEQAHLVDGWVGRVVRLHAEGPRGVMRPVLVPAFGFASVHYDERPVAAADTNRAWHDSRNLLAGLTWSRSRDFRTSFLDGMGETENLPDGRGLKLSASYIDGEFRDRTGLFLQGWRQDVRGPGQVLSLGLDLGGYLRAGRVEDGALRLGLRYVAPLRGGDRWRSRLLAGVRYHRAVRPSGGNPLSLGAGLGPRGLDLSEALGDERLVLDAEWRLFAPWVVGGFRFQFFCYADGALLGDQEHTLLDERLLATAGFGLRLKNPDLVFPAMQVRVAFLRGLDDNAAGIVLVTEDFRPPAMSLPGSRPGGFEFR